MPRWSYALLLLVPAALAAKLLSLPVVLVFVLSATGILPLAALIGKATDELAHQLGPRSGGLLNATFGNAAELIITSFAVRDGLLTLVKASITGSIIGNTLLVLGTSLLAGGARHGRQHYDPQGTSLNAAMMILAVAGLYLPATFASVVREQPVIEELSGFVAGVLLLTYVAYLLYAVFLGQPSGVRSKATTSRVEATADPRAGREAGGESWSGEGAWGRGKALGVLAGATVGTAISSEILVGSVEPVTRQLGWSEFFVGVIFVPIIGNAAEEYSAVLMAWRNRLNVSLGIAAGASTQIALFVAPVLVFLSFALGHPMDLVFTPLELVILGLATALFAYISLDGESNWLEGVQLLAIYLMAGSAFFFLPLHEAP